MAAVITDEEYKQLNWYRTTWHEERGNALRAEENAKQLSAEVDRLHEDNREQAEAIEALRVELVHANDTLTILPKVDQWKMQAAIMMEQVETILQLRATVAEQARQIEAAREMLDLFLKNSREVSEGDCIYCNCEQGGGNEHDCYYDCPMNDVRAWLAANAPTPTQGETESEA